MPLVTEIAIKVIIVCLINIAYEQVAKEPLTEAETAEYIIISEVCKTQ